MTNNNQHLSPARQEGRKRGAPRRWVAWLCALMAFTALPLRADDIPDILDDHFNTTQSSRDLGCLTIYLPYYESDGKDDVLQDGWLSMEVWNGSNKEETVNLLRNISADHQKHPYKTNFDCALPNRDKYRMEVYDGGSWREMYPGETWNDVGSFDSNSSTGDGYMYRVGIRVYLRDFHRDGLVYKISMGGDWDKNSSGTEPYLTSTEEIRYDDFGSYHYTSYAEWRPDKKLYLVVDAKNLGWDVAIKRLDVTIDGVGTKSVDTDIQEGGRYEKSLGELFGQSVVEKAYEESLRVRVVPHWKPKYSWFPVYRDESSGKDLTLTSFGQPRNLTAVLDVPESEGGDERTHVLLQWEMNEPAGSSITQPFRIERAERPKGQADFTPSDGEWPKTVDYNGGTKSYSFADEDIERDVEDLEYRYRLHRNTGSLTGYPVSEQTVVISTLHCSPDSITVRPNADGTALLVKWYDNDPMWTEGTTAKLTRYSQETESSSVIAELTVEEYKRVASGRDNYFEDKDVKNCTPYRYTIELTPGEAGVVKPASRTSAFATPNAPGNIEGLSVSKGYFTDRTELEWTALNAFDNFVIERKPYDSPDGEYKEVGTVTYTDGVRTYRYDDTKGAVGAIYSYRVYGVTECGEDLMSYSVDTLVAVGFRSTTGVITGRVTYENGQGVQDVEVWPLSDNPDRGKAVRFDGAGRIASDGEPAIKGEGFTFEALLRHADSKADYTVMSWGESRVGFDESGRLAFELGNYKVVDTKPRNGDRYYHFSAVYGKDTLRLYVDSLPVAETYAPAQPVPAGQLVIGEGFTGYMDEVRVWNKALTKADIKRNYTRRLYGGEAGLALYYRFDEGVSDEVYDLSFEGDEYHERHATAEGVSYVTDPAELPTMEQLAVKGMTDANGNYTINGVPYTGNGTQYRVQPRYGTHLFDPVEKVVTMTGSMNNFTIDFTDKSSFSVAGHVYYSESTIPVPGVMFEIDGVTAMVDNEVVQTGSDGSFRLNVPIGLHKLRAVKANHRFRNDGYLLTAEGGHRFYGEPLEGVEFRDETRVRLVGRVAGGPVQQAKALGHSLSENNLGEELGVKLTLAGSAANMYAIYDDEQLPTAPDKATVKEVTVEHFRPSYWDKDRKTQETEVTYAKDHIQVVPSDKTGEFFLDLIPTAYTVTEATATGHGNFIEGSPLQLNLTDSLLGSNVPYTYIIPEDDRKPGRDTLVHDTLLLDARVQLIKRVAPTLEVAQLDRKGAAMDFWGDSIATSNRVDGTIDTVQVYSPDKQGAERYLFGLPMMQQEKTYSLQASVFEAYPYYEKDNPAAPTATDRVPVTDGIVNFDNDLQYIHTVDTVHVRPDGTAHYQFIAGNPSLSSEDGSKSLQVTVQIDGMTIDDQESLDVIVLGNVLSGNSNFTTQGPNVVTTVLRDPPGSGSYSFLEAGTSFEYSSSYIGSMNLSEEAGALVQSGVKLTTSVGAPGATTDTENVLENVNVFTAVFEENVEGTEGTVSRMSLTNRWQTSDDLAYVGADADLYIGKSTNVIISKGQSLEIVRNGEFNEDLVDKVVAGNDTYSLIQREAMNMGMEFATTFVYPQIHIEEILIPQLKQQIAGLFTVVDESSGIDPQTLADNRGEVVYVPKVTDMDDPLFAKEGSYTAYVPKDYPSNRLQDTIMTLRQHFENWEKAIRDNERKKATAAKESGENLSFQAGANIERSMEFAGADVNVISFSIMAGAHQDFRVGSFINRAGVATTITLMETMTHGAEYSTTQEATQTMGFVLAEDGTDYLSVDIRKVNNDEKLDELLSGAEGDFDKDWSELLDDASGLRGDQQEYVFLTKGGATSCPWESGYTTKYYVDSITGKPVVIDQPTAQMEKPVLTVKESTVTNVPSSRRAVFELHLANESETGDDQYFMLSLIDESNPYGAKFYIDGGALGDGRTFLVPAGGELVKTLEVEKGTEMVYRDLRLCLHSLCQYDPTGFQDLIESTVSINVEFVPSSTDLTLAAPLDQWVLNTKSAKNDKGQYYLPVRIDEYDVNYEYFHHIDIEAKPSSSSDDKWVTRARFYKTEADMQAQDADSYSGEKYLIEGPEITYNLVFDSINDVDQRYDVRAASASLVQNQFIETVTPVAAGVKDTYRPRLFGRPQPADGILGVEDEIRLNFNETIAAGYITANNLRATGVRNGSLNTYSASVNFDGATEYVETELTKNYEGKDFTIEMNLQHSKEADEVQPAYRDEVLFAMGNMEIGFTASKQLRVKLGGTEILSTTLDDQTMGEWEHLAVVYEHGDRPTVTAYHNQQEVIGATPAEAYAGRTPYVIGADLNKTRCYRGRLNEFRIWSQVQTPAVLNKNRGIILSGAEAGLQAYYPMSAGKGDVLEDKAGGNHARMNATWTVSRPGRAAYFLGKSYVQYNTGELGMTGEMDYTLEFWFKSDARQNADAAMVASGRADAGDYAGPAGEIYVGFRDGKLVTRNNGYEHTLDGDYRDNDWHHYALTVSRSMDKASIYVDGELQGWFAASYFTHITAKNGLTVGACNWKQDDGLSGVGVDKTADYFTGLVDELRLWNICMNTTLIDRRSNTRVDKGETGLLFYVPFEDFATASGVSDMVFSIDEQVNAAPVLANTGALESEDAANIKDVAAEAVIDLEAVVNNDAMILNPTSEAAWNDFEQRIVTFTVTGIQDVNGNEIGSPVVWTAFIDRNHLKWSEENLHVECGVYEGTDFSVDIVNIGGMNQGYTLQGVPGWLDASSTSGNVAPQSSVTIDFHVSEVLNVGTYDEVIYLINDNGVARALHLTVKVNGETPDWSVNPSDYRYNMSVYGKLRMNGQFSIDEEDRIAAFRNGKCVGVAYNLYVKEYDMYYALLTVYSNDYEHDELEFRVWDASTGTIFIGTPSKALRFRGDAIEGTPMNPIVFDTKEMRLQNIALNSGWNWISFNVGSDDNVFERMFAAGTWANDDQVKSETDELFASYVGETAEWSGTLAGTQLSHKQMYLVKTANEQQLSLSGTPLTTMEQRTITLKPEWNYIAFLPTANMTVNEALTAYEAREGDIVKDQSSFAMYSPAVGWLGSLEYMKPGTGYMMYRAATDEADFVYPLLTANAANRTRRAEMTAAGESAAYPTTMSVVAVAGNIELQAGDRIVALAGDERRGASQAVATPDGDTELHFLSVAGDRVTALSFALEREGEIIATGKQRTDFVPDAQLGSLRAPYVIDFADMHTASVYPTLFDDRLHVTATATADDRIEIRMVDLTGRVVRSLHDVQAGNGGLQLTIDGLGHLASGMYLVDVRVNGESTIHKVEKK